MKAIQEELKRVFQVDYRFLDMELHNKVRIVEYFNTLDEVQDYIKRISNEHKVVDNEFYHCRENVIINIKEVFITHKKYNSVFNPKKSI